MAVITAQVSIQTNTNLPEDRITNTLHFAGNTNAGIIADVQTKIEAFYNTMGGAFSSYLTIGGHVVKYYDSTLPPPNAPLEAIEWSFTAAPTGITLPTEVSLVSSFKAAPAPGVSAGSLRGRIYTGTYNVGTNNSDGRPTTQLLNQLAGAAEDLAAVTPESAQVVWSTKLQTDFPIVEGFVDNEWDTQRRRGRDSTARVIWPTV